MKFTDPARIIVNPIAGGGRGLKLIQRLLPDLELLVGSNILIQQTQYVGHAIDLAAQANLENIALLIAVGGDGTINEVVNGLMKPQAIAANRCTLGILNCGSGADLVRSLKYPSSVRSQLQHIFQGKARSIDLGVVKFKDASGQALERYFVNECSIGISGAVIESLKPHLKRVHAGVAFAYAALGQLVNYRAVNLETTIDGQRMTEERFLGLMMANGRYAGGGMLLAPKAGLSDGLLDVLAVRDMGLARRLLTFGQIYFGAHLHNPHIKYMKAKEIIVNSEMVVPIEIDGEPIGLLPCEIGICPNALSLMA